MEEKKLTVHPDCKSPTFGLLHKADLQYGQAYVLDINKKSSAAQLFSSLKATHRAIRLSYIVEIAGHCIFSKSGATTFVVEPALTAKQKKHNANELALFEPNTKWSGNELPTNDLHVAKLSTKPRTKHQSCAKSRAKSKFGAKLSRDKTKSRAKQQYRAKQQSKHESDLASNVIKMNDTINNTVTNHPTNNRANNTSNLEPRSLSKVATTQPTLLQIMLVLTLVLQLKSL